MRRGEARRGAPGGVSGGVSAAGRAPGGVSAAGPPGPRRRALAPHTARARPQGTLPAAARDRVLAAARSRARAAVTWASRSPGACPGTGGGGPSGQDVVPAGGGGGITGRRQLPLRPQPQSAAPPSGAGVDPAATAAVGPLRPSRESPPSLLPLLPAGRCYVTLLSGAAGARPTGRDGG